MIFRSGAPDVVIPEMTFTDYVLKDAANRADKPALIDGPSGRTLTYGQLAAAIKKVAATLHQKGFGKGDVFAIYCPNLPEYAIIFHAVASLGGINTTINPLYTVGELTKQLNDAKARFLLTVPPFLDNAIVAAGKSTVEEVFVLGEAEGATPFSALMTADGAPPPVEIDPAEDLIVLPYSSGTSGLPKGVMLTHRNLVANICQTLGAEGFAGFTEDDTIVAVLPFFHIYGMIVIMNLGLVVGATLVTVPKFDMVEFLALMQDRKITVAPLVPPIVLGLAKHPVVDNYDLSNLRMIFCGAAPLGEQVSNEAGQRMNCLIAQGYGMTEASPVTHISPTDPDKVKVGSAGRVIPNTEVQLVDTASGKALGVGETGELWIRGPQIMKGYLNQPGETANSIDDEGWYKTGDIGTVDAEGNFFIVDRVKELIKYKGMQVAPAELEALLLSHPDVADVAVIPKPDEEAGEIPKAFIVLKPESQVSAEDIMTFTADHVAPHKKVRAVEFIDLIPKSASGKILRRVLVEKEREQAS